MGNDKAQLNEDSIKAAIRGAFVADAASMGTHWIYDPDEMAKEVSSQDAPEFKDPPTPRYYSADEYPGQPLWSRSGQPIWRTPPVRYRVLWRPPVCHCQSSECKHERMGRNFRGKARFCHQSLSRDHGGGRG
jgi:hypothetical protein